MTETTTTTNTSTAEGKTDEQLFDEFFDFLADGRISITTGYLKDDNGVLTHSAIIVRCGEFEGQSAPLELTTKLLPLEDKPEEAVN